jgi:hypothetical protein
VAAKQTSWLDDLLMAVSRRSNDIVGGAADLAAQYGVTPANSAAWVAQHIAGYSPQEAERIRRNLSGVGSMRNVVEAGVRSNENRFRRAGGVGSRAPEEVQMPTHLSAVTYNPGAVVRAVAHAAPTALQAIPGALHTAGSYVSSHTPSAVGRDVSGLLSQAYDAIKADPYGIPFDTALYPAFPLAASADDYAQLREASQSLEPYVKDDAEAAKAQNTVDLMSALPLAVAVPAAGSKALAVRRKLWP